MHCNILRSFSMLRALFCCKGLDCGSEARNLFLMSFFNSHARVALDHDSLVSNSEINALAPPEVLAAQEEEEKEGWTLIEVTTV